MMKGKNFKIGIIIAVIAVIIIITVIIVMNNKKENVDTNQNDSNTETEIYKEEVDSYDDTVNELKNLQSQEL